MDVSKFAINDNYGGSRTFTWLADLCGLPVDLINLMICQFLALFLASLFRSILHPSKVSSEIRHYCALTLGLAIGYFCFGQEAIHIAALPAICYIVIRTQNPAIVQIIVLIVAMSYLLSVHLLRMIYDYGSYSLDITGPLMIITQKVTSLAFNIHDGFVSERNDLTKGQQYYAIKNPPSSLEYFSYVLHFQGVMVGPLVFYKDYIEFIDGSNIFKTSTANGNLNNGKSRIVIEPSPTKAVIKKVISSLICATIFMKFAKLYPIKHMKDYNFVKNESIGYKFWYIMMSTTGVRFKYYHAWLLADAICNNSGLGFAGYDKEGNPKWDLISNINVLPFEFATNMREAINNWNIGTNRWLRFIVYERVPPTYGTVLTFALSAVWHGFYAGYYVTFATGALMVTAARVARHLFRHRFQRTQYTRMFYDITTCAITRLVMGYTTFPFVLLEFMGSTKLYLKLYLCLHLIALFTIFVLSRLMKIDKQSKNHVFPINTVVSNLNYFGKEEKSCFTAKTKSLQWQLSSMHKENYNKKQTDLNKIRILNTLQKQPDEDAGENNLVQKRRQMNSIITNGENNFILSPETVIIAGSSEMQQQSKHIVANSAHEAVSVKHDQCEMDNLSNKIKEKIDIEAKNIEDFIDKTVNETVTGIVEFRNDLMRNSDKLFILKDGIRNRASSPGDKLSPPSSSSSSSLSPSLPSTADGVVDAFIKKEIGAINAAVQQANVLPAVLSNGHAK